MKILHTSDWHIGKKLESFSRLKEQQEVLEEIGNIAHNHNVDAVIIAGDLFDNFNPATEAIDLFYKTVKKLSNQGQTPVIAISGNHDSPDRIESPDPLARECGIIFVGYPNSEAHKLELESGLKIVHSEPGYIELSLPNYNYPLRIIATPYANEHRIKKYLDTADKEKELRLFLQEFWKNLADKYCDDKGVNMLTTHLFVIPKDSDEKEEADDEKPITHVGGAQAIFTNNFPDKIQYVALGHIHKYKKLENPTPIVYSGSPIAYSFAEAQQQKYVTIIEAEPGQKVQLENIPLQCGKRLTRLHAIHMNNALELLSHHKNDLIELTIDCDTFLTAAERKQLNDTHPHIITLIPNVKSTDITTRHQKNIDLMADRSQLFKEYFEYVHGAKPNENIMNLFNEILSANSNNQ